MTFLLKVRVRSYDRATPSGEGGHSESRKFCVLAGSVRIVSDFGEVGGPLRRGADGGWQSRTHTRIHEVCEISFVVGLFFIAWKGVRSYGKIRVSELVGAQWNNLVGIARDVGLRLLTFASLLLIGVALQNVLAMASF